MAMDTEKIRALFGRPPKVVNVGLDLFAEALDAQGVEAARVDWRPPVIELEPAAAAILNDPWVEQANAEAVGRRLGLPPDWAWIPWFALGPLGPFPFSPPFPVRFRQTT